MRDIGTGYHRKHAIRVLCYEPVPPRTKPDLQRRYDDQVRAALITLWEAADRICGKRLKVLIPTLEPRQRTGSQNTG